MWDSGTGQAIGNPLEGHTALVRSVCGSYDATIRIWSCHTRQLIRTIEVDYFVYAVTLFKDRIAAAVGSKVCVFHVQTGDQIALMEGHSVHVRTVAFASDGVRLPGHHNSYMGCSRKGNAQA
jgi:WD40 repeat protein